MNPKSHAKVDPPFMQFLGAAQMVGGSCYLIDTGSTRLIIDSESIKLVSTGDLGNKHTALLRDSPVITSGDYVLVESTYGTTRHGELNVSVW